MSDKEQSMVKSWLVKFSLILAAQTVALIAMGVSDHFTLQQNVKDMSEVKPRVVLLWWSSVSRKP